MMAGDGMSGQRVVVDSSSAILLQKVAFLHPVLEYYRVVIPPSVYREITLYEKEGSVELGDLLDGMVRRPRNSSALTGMGKGERDTIQLFLEGFGDFILIDDKKALQYCRVHGIPFINSLLVPRILYEAKIIDKRERSEIINRIIEAGYYSAQIISQAEQISAEELQVFLPVVKKE